MSRIKTGLHSQFWTKRACGCYEDTNFEGKVVVQNLGGKMRERMNTVWRAAGR
jgi:hypothetical protein